MTDKQGQIQDSFLDSSTSRMEPPGEQANQTRTNCLGMEEGSVNSSTFIMSKMAIGLGCLAFPQSFGYLSFTWGIALLLIVSVLNYWSFYILGLNSLNLKAYEYATQVRLSLGKYAQGFYYFLILLQSFLVMIVIQVIGNLSNS